MALGCLLAQEAQARQLEEESSLLLPGGAHCWSEWITERRLCSRACAQPGHVVLSLRSAMTQFYKLENFATAAIFARRLLEMNAPAKVSPSPGGLPLHC